MCESEVARLRHQIELELESLQRGMNGFATGTSRHRFIRTRMDRVGHCQDRLTAEVGEERANEIVFGIYVETIK